MRCAWEPQSLFAMKYYTITIKQLIILSCFTAKALIFISHLYSLLLRLLLYDPGDKQLRAAYLCRSGWIINESTGDKRKRHGVNYFPCRCKRQFLPNHKSSSSSSSSLSSASHLSIPEKHRCSGGREGGSFIG